MKRLTILSLFLVGCSWSTFDDLSTATPLHAQEKPDGVKVSDYGVQIVGVTEASQTSGGRLAVLSTGGGNYSTLDFDTNGGTALGDSETLGQHTIDSLTGNAILITDGMGQVALIDNSNVGTIVAIHGAATGLSVDTQVPTSMKPDAAVFAGARLVVAAGPMTVGGPNLFSVAGSGVNACTVVDDVGMPLSVAAMAADATHLWVWTKAGAFFGYLLTSLDQPTPCVIPAPATPVFIAGAPANGGHIDIAGTFGVLTQFDSPQTMVGQVSVVTLATGAIVGSPLVAHGVRSATFGTFDGMGAVALGFPNRAVGSTTNAGAVDLHLLDLAAGTITPTPDQSLSDSQATSNLTFGRALTTMSYNGKPIVVVSASSVIYAFYQTTLYTKR